MKPLSDYTRPITLGFIYVSAVFFGFCVGGAIGYGLIFLALVFISGGLIAILLATLCGIGIVSVILGGKLGIFFSLHIAEKLVNRINWESRLHLFYAICGSVLTLVLGIVISFYILYITTLRLFFEPDEIISSLLPFI